MQRVKGVAVVRIYANMTGVVLLGLLLVLTGNAADESMVRAKAAFADLDRNEDGVLSGREVKSVLEFDTDGDGEVSLTEFLGGHRRKDQMGLKPADLRRLFASKDANEDGVLSGKEVKGFEAYDSDRDREVTWDEFVAGSARQGTVDVPRREPEPIEPKVEQPTDPKLKAWNDQLSRQLDHGKRWAVIIGINQYAESPLRYCVPDARLVSETLVKQCFFQPEQILLMTDDQKDPRLQPKKINLQTKIPELLQKVGKNDTVVIYFAGHGMAAEGQSFLCPLDFNGKSPKLTGWRIDELRTALQDCDAGQKLLIIDCCHSGGVVTTSGFGATPQELGGAFESAQGMITIAGCRTNQTSLESEELGHGVFTAMLADGLAGQADFDRNGIIDSDELYKHLLMTVPAAAQQVVADRKQFPVRIIGQDVVGVFALARLNARRGTGREEHQEAGRFKLLKPGDVVVNSIGLKLVMLPTGLFVMGSPASEYLRDQEEKLVPTMRRRALLMGVYEVTQSQYSQVMGANPSWFSRSGSGSEEVAGIGTDDFPVENVSWGDAMKFCEKLSAMPNEIAAGRKYRLPTEAEWEHACRAGAWTAFHTGDLISPRQANIRGDRPYLNSPKGTGLGRTTRVGSYSPNLFGLCDMHGNVGEWCLDRLKSRGWSARFEAAAGSLPAPNTAEDIMKLIEDIQALQVADPNLELPIDPIGVTRGDPRVYRGGSYFSDVGFVRSASHREQNADYSHKTIGFRVVCEIKKK